MLSSRALSGAAASPARGAAAAAAAAPPAAAAAPAPARALLGGARAPPPGRGGLPFALRGLPARARAPRARRGLAGAPAAAAAAPAPPAAAPRDAALPARLHGFVLEEDQYIAEYDTRIGLYRHEKTGARVASAIAADENKCFGAVFRTPVANSKGVPHILEHSLLCGSRKYPIKEPFVELLKGSLHTFLNAFTYPDRTCYPVASTNLADFYNLVDVYLDAVLHPACVRDPRIFAQEGWHLEVEAGEGGAAAATPATLKGVVFNEMKGVYSSPDSVHGRATLRALHPDTTYAHDSGGDPAAIPDLTFDEFRAFYEAYYHPSNGRFWFYGDDPPEERLRRLGVYLDEFDAAPVASDVPPQPLWAAPRRHVERYAAGAEGGDAGEPKAFVSVNWLLAPDRLDLQTELALGFLNHLLLGTPAAPLLKALNDSGLGESVIGGGVEDDLRQPAFSIGLKGVAEGDIDKVEKLVLDTLARVRAEGFSPGAVEAAVNTIEFSLRENNTGRFPRGLSLMLRAVGAWVYDADPLAPLRWRDDLEALKARLAAPGGADAVFGPLIDTYLTNNPHRVTVEVRPDRALGGEQEAAEAAKVAALTAGWDGAATAAAAAATAELRERQETPDAPDALACVPSLSLADIPRPITPVPTAVSDVAGGEVQLLTHDLFTNDVLYADVALPLAGVPAELLPLVPLFCSALTQMGTAAESKEALIERIGRTTGGLSASPFISAVRGSEADVAAYVIVRGKAMAARAGDLLDLARDVLLSSRLDDRERFRQMVLETRAGMEAAVVGAGHSYAASRLDAQRSLAGYLSELTGGVAYLDYVRALAKRVDDDWDGVRADLEAIRAALARRGGALVNLTADARTLSAAAAALGPRLLDALPAGRAPAAGWAGRLGGANEALLVPTQVNYVCKAANLYADAGYELRGSAYVASKLLGTTWLWDRVRVSGGAYGGFCDLDTHSGVFTFSSYRDPNLLKTVGVYDGAPGFLRALELTPAELQKAIIGTVGDIDSYQLPDAKGRTQFSRHLLGVTDEERQARRDEVLGTTLADFRAFGDVLGAALAKGGRVAAVTSQERLDAAHAEAPGFFSAVKRVL